MDKKLTKQEFLTQMDQLIQQKVEETGRSYMEIGREMMHKLQEKKEPEITPMDKDQTQKMQDYNRKESLAVAEMMKSPMSSEEKDRVIQEHYEVHNQVNPNKKTITKEQFRELIRELELKTGKTPMEIIRELEHLQEQKKERDQKGKAE